MTNQKLTYGKIAVYLIIFFTIWSIRELIIRPIFLSPMDDLTYGIVESSMKVLVWTVPAVLLIKYFQDDMWISLREMFTNRLKWFKEAPLLLLVFFPVAEAVISQGGLVISPYFNLMRLFEPIIFVGITEELVFRGFLLNAFLKKVEPVKAVIASETLFALIHVPIWIYRGFDVVTILVSLVSVFVIGALFAFSFIKTKNIWVPIVLHMAWNLFVIGLVR
ncbi:MAG: CPBP family intramembrane metalloprotease [Defluviitaleaceae bacterium]|nr:CPBP family intramembrane metalloprotease [Defluviitaleaceae bacterium]